MKCAYLNCKNPLSSNPTRYPSVDYMNRTLGHPVTVAEIDQFVRHEECTFAPTFGREATILYIALYNGEKISTANPTKPEPITLKPSLQTLKQRALEIRYRYSLNFTDSQTAAERAFDRGTSLTDELRALSNGRRLNATMEARRNEKKKRTVLVFQEGPLAVVEASIDDLLNS